MGVDKTKYRVVLGGEEVKITDEQAQRLWELDRLSCQWVSGVDGRYDIRQCNADSLDFSEVIKILGPVSFLNNGQGQW